MAEPIRFVAIGDVMVDVTVAGRGHDARVRLAPGGTATNAALSAARVGADVTTIGRVGDDAAGRMLERELVERGISSQLGIDPTSVTGTFLVVDGEVRADRGANAAFLPEHLPAKLDADVTLVSGYVPEETVIAALGRSRARWNALAAAGLRTLPSAGNAVFLNEVEAATITGAGPLDAVEILGERYRLVCVTRGADGAIAALDGGLEKATPAAQYKVEAPGAGDALAAAMLVALASGSTLRDALAAGLHAATFVLTPGSPYGLGDGVSRPEAAHAVPGSNVDPRPAPTRTP